MSKYYSGISRREFLNGSIGCASFLASGLGWPTSTSAQPAWGTPDEAIYTENFFPANQPYYKILEVFLYGGLSPWENFYHRAVPDGAGYRGFHLGSSEVATALHWHTDNVVWGEDYRNCVAEIVPATTPGTNNTSHFVSKPGGHEIHFGPATKPIWRSDIMDRTRVVVMQHELLPHEAAIPYAATGWRLGQPSMAGLGAAIQRRAQAAEESLAVGERRTIPWSYVLEPTNLFTTDNLDAFKATGTLPGTAKPVTLKIVGQGILALLDRPTKTPATDALLRFYRDEYTRLISFPGQGLLRSRGFNDYEAALTNVLNADQLRTLLQSSIQPLRDGVACVTPDAATPRATNPNQPATGLLTAARLLSHPASPARYVCVIDAGLDIAPGGGGYDTHGSRHSSVTATNLFNILATIRRLIDTNQLNLDTTLIVLTTEFGRTPFRSSGGFQNGSSNGRDHWPSGYVNILIGGPISSRDVLGKIQDGDLPGGEGGLASNNGVADPGDVFNATDIRAAALLAAGVNPFETDLFGVGDVSLSLRSGTDAIGTARNIVRRFFPG